MASATAGGHALNHATKADLEQSQHIDEKSSESDGNDLNVITWTEKEEKAVRNKIDWYIVPLVTFLYLLCFLDRANIGNARIQGMQEDLALYGYRFNWAGSIFYIVYLLVEVPSNIILKRVGPRFYLPLLVVGFGVVSMCTAFVKDFAGLCTARAFLGIFEGGAMPGIAFFLSCFYKRKELYFRIGIFVSAASMAGAFGGLLATGLARIPRWGSDAAPIHTWRNIFFFEGLITIFAGLLAPIIMPQSPSTCKWLTERQRYIAHERLIREYKSDPMETVKARHVKRAVFNVNNIVAAGGFFAINVTVQGVSIFMPTILADLGWTATQAQLYSVPPYVCACFVAILVAFISDKTQRRGVYLASFTFLGIAGFSILRWYQGVNARYGAVYLVVIGAFPGGPGFLSWAVNNTAGPNVRAVASGYIVSLGTMGGILATWAYLRDDAPLYHIGHNINLSMQVLVLCLASFGIYWCHRENRLRDQGKRDHRLNGLTEAEQADLGHLHPSFRYIS
ncbi:uncharacterized protein HMPREF1541_01168 [Cyphellophora europaea CBS 101466]|uniref:Major facilitator superfamily (MFS) profile domain-containing protein n=1 Tax=Cyphellophora europaea (strain CBS 101466) TaxID=1220924 RepID=W2SG55_CYPE1|nr:uncharacterized protein HMPREF1541_01168 [Cyphellophora europaea CBS 101466]ETN46978.1 hypothetical protein HMPREF1541_01168 [Cyphellophora europaea CBS 101466]